MKKIVSFIALSGIMIFTSSAFAASFTDTNSTVIGGGTFKVSKGVTLSVTSTTSAYSAIAGHTNGDKEYGTTNADPKIFTKAKTVGATPTACNSSTYDFSTWTAN